jgi:hypothetical protein
MFIFPVTEIEAEEVTKNFKGKYSVGINQISDYVIKKCIEAIKNPLAHICNAFIELGIFLDRLKTTKFKNTS